MSGGLARAELLERLKDVRDSLTVTPLPSDSAVGAGTVDLSVGSLILSAERAALEPLDTREPWRATASFREITIRPDGHFYIQPRQFVLASTFEYVVLPTDYCGFIQSRSTYGRMGLISVTAAYVAPSYRGCPTLELANVGEVPICVRPYTALCQLVLFPADGTGLAPSRYQCATRPSFARSLMEE